MSLDRRDQLKQLQRLAELRRDADTAKLSKLKMGLRAVELQVAQLEKAAVESTPNLEGISPYQNAGHDVIWDGWRQTRLRELSLQLAQVRADIEQQRQVATRSVGKHKVIGKLRDRFG